MNKQADLSGIEAMSVRTEKSTSSRRFRFVTPARSLAGKIVLLIAVFIIVPFLIYDELERADQEKQAFLAEAMREQGRLVTRDLQPLLNEGLPPADGRLNEELRGIIGNTTGVRVLFRPNHEIAARGLRREELAAQGLPASLETNIHEADDVPFFFVAAEPPLTNETLLQERSLLQKRGVFAQLSQSCEGEVAASTIFDPQPGPNELLTSITPYKSDSGCWIVVTTDTNGAFLGLRLGDPYWMAWEVRVAAVIYMVTAILILSLFVSVLRNLNRFRDMARLIRQGFWPKGGFKAENRVPELAPVAGEFDNMTQSLRQSADDLRRTAEDNAHAFKTPIAIIRQSLEPLEKSIAADDRRGQRAIEVVESAIARLDRLVSSSRHIDETLADLIDPPRDLIDLSELMILMLESYEDAAERRHVRLKMDLQSGVKVRGGDVLLETVLENILDNALEVSPEGAAIEASLHRILDQAVIRIRDHGPGVPESQFNWIFERYHSMRSGPEGESTSAVGGRDDSHMGIGLWIVRRNLTAIGGTVEVRNAEGGGFEISLFIPLAE